ncbi:hypothetical protein NEOLEDRAFT_1173717 [Neolentinus lepideus HHB14362 ss-1]|uniref:Uncharacterized protein n=1 Tax=Neolentinus lepideus HHB14362 ss-1 TaxID=1314782 RepID=A0A165MBM2_9AGAM|nr:hypothetical protein NEOLEDRAFT_1173717 [Neolentinus lepideus HHB14362 ss-1]
MALSNACHALPRFGYLTARRGSEALRISNRYYTSCSPGSVELNDKQRTTLTDERRRDDASKSGLSDPTNKRSDHSSVSSQSKPDQSPTLAQRDEALKRALEEMSGEGGQAGLELEDGQPVAMKRGVRNNMFRYI